MNRSRHATFALICIAGLALGAALPLPVFASADSLGQHVVQKGETLYCIGRGYGIVPSAIAEANGLSAYAFLYVGQVLRIPSVQWSPIPPGPVCARQFASPITGGAVVTLTATPPATSVTTYTVRRGDSLYRIALKFGVTVAALFQANNITNPNLIYPGQVLVIPSGPTLTVAPTATVTPPGTPLAADVQITDIRFDGAVFQVESDEYAVITNRGGAAVNLSGWRLNAGDAGQDFVFPSFDLHPGQSCRVYTNEVHAETCGFSFGSGQAIWKNDGDCGYLYDVNGNEVSRKCYSGP